MRQRERSRSPWSRRSERTGVGDTAAAPRRALAPGLLAADDVAVPFTRAGTGSSAIVTSNSPARAPAGAARRRPPARARAARRPCSARADRRQPPLDRARLALAERADRPGVGVGGVAARRALVEDPHRPRARGERRVVAALAEGDRRLAVAAGAVSTVTARSGTARSPRLATSSRSVAGSAIRCSAGNEARGHVEVELARRRVGVLALPAASRGRERSGGDDEQREASTRAPHSGGDHTSGERGQRPDPAARASPSVERSASFGDGSRLRL